MLNELRFNLYQPRSAVCEAAPKATAAAQPSTQIDTDRELSVSHDSSRVARLNPGVFDPTNKRSCPTKQASASDPQTRSRP